MTEASLRYQTPTPQQNKQPILLSIILAVFFTLLISGLSVYIWQQYKFHSAEIILPTKIAQTPTIITTTNVPTKVDTRKELSHDEWISLELSELKQGVKCDEFFLKYFKDKPNSTIVYSSSLGKYSIKLPYNNAWGGDKYKVKPYDLLGENILFGQPYGTEGCTIARISLSEISLETLDATIQKINIKNETVKKTDLPFDGFVDYKIITDQKFPILKMDVGNALFENIPEYRVFLPNIILDISDPFFVNDDLIYTLVDTIEINK